MDSLVLLARVVLALVFLTAGVGKLLDPAGSRKAMADFGVPAALAGLAGWALPIVELAIAALLIPTATAWYAALASLALLLVFVAGIGVNLARGRAPDCHCFGQIHSEPVGWPTLARNGVLALIALGTLAKGLGQPSLAARAGSLSGLEAALLVAGLAILAGFLLIGWLLLHLVQQNGRLLVRLEALEAVQAAGPTPAASAPTPAPSRPAAGLPVGSPAPAFSLGGLYGETLTLDALRAQGRPVMLIFTDTGCGPCNALLPELGRWQREQPQYTIALLSRGPVEQSRAKATEHRLSNVLIQPDREVAEAFRASGTPSAVLIGNDGRILSPLAQGAEQIRELVKRTPETASAPAAPVAPNGGNGRPPVAPAGSKVGQPAPAIKLPNLGGKTVELSDYQGNDTLVLFWNPGCGFCQRMLDDLKAWEATPPAGAPKLLVISTGTGEANTAQGLRSTVLLDSGFSVGRSFGASGTPSAVLVDRHGKIASELAVGAPGVLALAGGQPLPQPAAPAPTPARPVARLGELAPPIKLPDLNGKTVRLSDYRGSETLVVFWNPTCGFCQRMLPELKAWEESRPKDGPKLLLVSRGGKEENAGYGLRSTIVLDQDFRFGPAYGAMGTPMAVLIDADGRVASEVIAGADAILSRARGGAGQASG